MEKILQDKNNALRNILLEIRSVVVAYSGGVDSTLLAYLASQTLGQHALAITTISPSLPEEELIEAQEIARQFGFQHILIQSHELEDPRYLENTPLRCYWCKQEIFGLLVNYAKGNNFAYVIDGTNYDDRVDYRPGRKAAQEIGIRSPLLELEFTKEEVRTLAHQLSLPNWNKPAMACLSTRVPHGICISSPILRQIAASERVLKNAGIQGGRVRHHGEIARIEINSDDFEILISNREQITNELKKIGYKFITMDLLGYQMSSFNQPQRE